jgi:hypothetical protein
LLLIVGIVLLINLIIPIAGVVCEHAVVAGD